MNVQSRNCGFDRTQQGQVGLAGVTGIDPALHADLGGASVPGLRRPPRDFVKREVIRPTPQLLSSSAFRKSAEAALEGADVGVIDIAVDDVAYDCAVGLLAQFICRRKYNLG